MAQYKWFFEENGVQTECKPIVADDLSLDYGKETNNQFYRAKLSGGVDFRFEFDDIISKGYNYTYILVCKSYDENLAAYDEIWRGKFTLTDCEINVDTKTLSVKPNTIDKYTTILEHLEDEYNFLKIKPTQQGVNVSIRPCFQIYNLNNSKLTNYIGGNIWEQSCSSVGYSDIANYGYNKIDEKFAIALWFRQETSLYNNGKPILFIGTPDESSPLPRIFELTPVNFTMWPSKAVYGSMVLYSDETNFVISIADVITPGVYTNVENLCECSYERGEAGTEAAVTIFDTQGNIFKLNDAIPDWQSIYTRCIIQHDESTITIEGGTYNLTDLGANDMAGTVGNYNKIMDNITGGLHVYCTVENSATPTQWGLNYADTYFIKDTQMSDLEFPIGQGIWRIMSTWGLFFEPDYTKFAKGAIANRTIKDCYTLTSAIKQLAQLADSNIVFDDNDTYSQFLSSLQNPLDGTQFFLLLTQKSNVLSSYYDTPAQNAPITLKDIFDMLRNLFKVYWHIDDNYNLHVEHISYYQGGLSYSDNTSVILDLETLTHTRTKSVKDFGQNKYKYEKTEMPATYTYEYADSETIPFTGYPMKATDVYVSQGQKEDVLVAKFAADIDYMLVSPDEFSKEGFALIGVPIVSGSRVFSTDIKNFVLQDEDGVEREYEIQNIYCAVGYLSEKQLRYSLPCENWIINNKANTAISTGSYKLQTVEFADITLNDIIKDTTNCIKKIRTQQGDGDIKTLSINLNSFASKADLLFNFIGRWYYLRGTALNGTITIDVNGETKTINVSNNTFIYKYSDMITALDFNGSDVVSVDFTDTDKLENLTSCDDMFKNCTELLSVNFGGKRFAAVTTANDMFYGCSQLTTLDCPDTSTWKPDIDLSDCPNLTTESYYSLIRFLYDYESGVHTITPNSTFWNNLTADVQTDITTKAQAKGWQINMPAQYSISGTSGGNTVYVTINGVALELDSTGGTWQYDYNTPITSLSFENDADVVDIDFSNSDGLTGLTSLANTFKGCSGLTTVDFTNCDLTNVTNAADCFSGCGALYSVTIASGTWKPDVDLSASNSLMYGEMLNFVSGLYTYTSGTHTIIFNSTIWGNMTEAEQTNVFNACAAKEWTCNAVQPTYYIRGTSSNVGNNETFNIQFIQDGAQTPDAAETITCAVDGNGNFEHEYHGKKIYQMISTFMNNTTITSVEFNEPMDELISMGDYPNGCFFGCSNLASVTFANNSTFAKLTSFDSTFTDCVALTSVDLSMSLFPSLTIVRRMFMGCTNLQSVAFDNANTFNTLLNMNNWFTDCVSLTSVAFLSNAQFANVTTANTFFNNCDALTTIDLHSATFASLTITNSLFDGSQNLVSVDLSSATFANLTSMNRMFASCPNLTTITWSSALNLSNVEDARQCFLGCSSLTDATIAVFANQTFASLRLFSNFFYGCTTLTNIDFSSATFANVTNLGSTFMNCSNVLSIDLSSATFANVVTCQELFANCQKLTSIVGIGNFTFASATTIDRMFFHCDALTSIDLHSATFASATSAIDTFRYCGNITSLNINLANWSNVTLAGNFIRNNSKLTTIIISVNNGYTKANSTSGCNITESPLTYQSMLNVANWLPITTTSRSVTFKTSAFNALSAAEQANIQGLVTGKNWTLALA